MAYTNTLGVITLGEEETPPSVDVELWRTWTTISDDGVATDHESSLGSTTVNSGLQVAFAIGPPALQPVAQSPSDFITLTVRTPGEPGYLFRSQPVSSLPNPGSAADAVDIWRTGPSPLTNADIAAGLPSVPIVVDPLGTTTITALTATLGPGGINVVALGTVVVGPATSVTSPATDTFRYTLPVSIAPALIHAPAVALVAIADSDGVLTFSGNGLGNSLLSVVLNVLAPFIKQVVLPDLMGRINSGITTAVVARALSALGEAGATPPPGGVLPPGVGLSVERVVLTPAAGTVWASLHSFGNLRSILFPGAQSPSINCAVMALAPLLPGALPPMLRQFRDQVLATTADGPELIRLYYRHAPALAALCLRDATLRSAAVAFLAELQTHLRQAPAPQAALFALANRHFAKSGGRLPAPMRRDFGHWLDRAAGAVPP